MMSPCAAQAGNSRRSAGRSSRESAAETPERSITSITPHHRQMAPPVAITNFTASWAPSAAAAPTAAEFPLAAPYRTDSAIMPNHMQLIIIAVLLRL